VVAENGECGEAMLEGCDAQEEEEDVVDIGRHGGNGG